MDCRLTNVTRSSSSGAETDPSGEQRAHGLSDVNEIALTIAIAIHSVLVARVDGQGVGRILRA
jgi:hypothetical protein